MVAANGDGNIISAHLALVHAFAPMQQERIRSELQLLQDKVSQV